MNHNQHSNSNQWIRSKWWDTFWVLSGFWLLIPYIIQLGDPTRLYLFHISLLILFWMGHRYGTVFIPFCLAEYEQLVHKQKSRFVYFPFSIFFGTIIFLLIPESFLPLNQITRVKILVFIRFYFDLWHFASQHYGVISLYRLRAKQNPGSQFKKIEKTYCMFVTLGVGIVATFLNLSSPSLAGITIRDFFLANKEFWQVAGSLTMIIFLMYLIVSEFKLTQPSIPKMLYIVSIGSIGIISLYSHPLLLWFILAGQHYIVATGLIIQIVGNSSIEKGKNFWYSMWAPFCRNQFTMLILLCLVSILMAYMLKTVNWSWSKRLPAAFLPQLTEGFFFKFMVGVGYALSFSHYVWDRAIYRMSDKEVRDVSLPLLLK